jgi:hypothetical protein
VTWKCGIKEMRNDDGDKLDGRKQPEMKQTRRRRIGCSAFTPVVEIDRGEVESPEVASWEDRNKRSHLTQHIRWKEG